MHITKFAEEKVRSILSENKLFLRLAVQSLIELIVNDPDKYEFLMGSARKKNSEKLLDYISTSTFRSVMNSSSSSHIDKTLPALKIQAKQKVDGEAQRLQQQPLLLKDGLEMLVQEGKTNLLNNLVRKLAPTIIALLMLIVPKSDHSLPLVPEEQVFPFQDHREERSQT